MTNSNINLITTSALILIACVLAGCGGTKILKEPEPLAIGDSIAAGSDQRLSAALDWVIFRDGPGTWARNADWDEYLIRVENAGDDSLQIIDIAVVDSLGVEVNSREDRRQLIKGTKETERRYRDDGIKVKAGLSGTVLVGASVAAAAGTSGLGAAAMAGGGAAAGAAAVVVLVPALAVGGIARGVNNGKVNVEIESRQTPLPLMLVAGEKKSLNVFFPLAPSPQEILVTYADSQGQYMLAIDTRTALEGLHLAQAAERYGNLTKWIP